MVPFCSAPVVPFYSALDSYKGRFYIHERQSLQFRWEAFNFTNHTNFRQPRTTVDTANAATITSARAARVMQFGLRYQF